MQVSTRTTTRPEIIWEWREKAGSLGDCACLAHPSLPLETLLRSFFGDHLVEWHRCVHQVSFQVNKPTTPAKTNYCARHEPCGARRPSMLIVFFRVDETFNQLIDHRLDAEKEEAHGEHSS